jgi:hypothetical protein
MSLAVEFNTADPSSPQHKREGFWQFQQRVRDQVPIERPNYRFELLRLLLDAHLTRADAPSLADLIKTIGASQTPIRNALADLKQAGLLTPWSRGLHVNIEVLTQELLAQLRALPQVLRFRYERGTAPKSSAALLARSLDLLQSRTHNGWHIVALSGVPVALEDGPAIDLVGTPRLDMVAHVPRGSTIFNAGWLRQLDDGLELEPSVLTPAPVAITLIRANSHFAREAPDASGTRACAVDVFFSLLDLGLRDQAMQYARAVA